MHVRPYLLTYTDRQTGRCTDIHEDLHVRKKKHRNPNSKSYKAPSHSRTPTIALVVPLYQDPDAREDLKRISPNLEPYTTKGYFIGTPLRDLLFGSSQNSGECFRHRGTSVQVEVAGSWQISLALPGSATRISLEDSRGDS